MAGVGVRLLPVMGWLALLLLALCTAGAQGLYFHIGETEKCCFIKEIPDETMVIGNYRTQMWDKQKEVFLPSTPGLGMHVEVKDPDSKVVLSRQYSSEGRFTFTSYIPGDHQICLHSNSTKMALCWRQTVYREERFRLTSESTNQRVLWCFFEAKKLV
uniref:GOLD domain-containing protein n=1 Tax=Propithecus coquereli TaxID=379532 RepID=A0A2K6EE63_PROCO